MTQSFAKLGVSCALALAALQCFAVSCGGKAKVVAQIPVAFTLSGTLRIAPLPPTLSAANFSYGHVNLRIYSTSDEGYCLRSASTLVADAYDAVPAADFATLQIAGLPYHLDVLEVPNQHYPITLHVIAEWQSTTVREHTCEIDPTGVDRYNARGAFGPDPSNTSACCGEDAVPLIVHAQSDTLSGKDIELQPYPARTGGMCDDPNLGYTACVLRHAPDFSDSACWTALGADAPLLIQQANGSACP